MIASEEQVRRCFDKLLEPKLKWNINTLNLLKSIDIQGDEVCLKVNLITDNPKEISTFQTDVEEAMKALGFTQIHCKLGRVNVPETGIQGISKIILVGSGKGGVGKSNVAANLATSLAQQGMSVGLMDADIYGPSLPALMGIHEKPEVLPNEFLMPITAHGVKTMSIGYLVSPEEALDWRGQMCSGTIIQFIHQTLWGNLDYLIIDLPPGTGDITLTIAHKIKCDGVVLVTTPSELALNDVRRAVTLFEQRQVPILGLVENMSHYTCESCQHKHSPFKKKSHLESDESLSHLDCLGQIPLSAAFSESLDLGLPIVLNPNATEIRSLYEKITATIMDKVELKTSGYSTEKSQMA